ncbi:MAG: ABC transporter permease [Kiritimatiellae bacterium]|nr:ABC transporter permease [Kiritimatiellia bacterium]
MRLQAKQFLTLAGMTALEAVRQPICLLIVATCILFTAFLPFLLTHTLGEEGKLVRDSALALHFVFGLLLGSYASSATLSREIRRGTAGSILSKPVGRATFFLAKYTGIAAVMVLFSAAAAVATLIVARAGARAFVIDWWAAGPLLATVPVAFLLAGIQNYFTGRPFASNAFGLVLFALAAAFVTSGFTSAQGEWGAFGAAVPWQILPACVLLTLAILVLSAIATGLAARLETMPTLAVCSVVFVLGLMSDYLFGRHAGAHRAAAILYALIPNWQNFWVADALTDGGLVPWAYVGRAAGYAALYLAAVLGLGMLSFRRREITS